MAVVVGVKMIADDLFRDPERRGYASQPEVDALTEEGALQEAALVDVRFSPLESWVGILFDLRLALQLRMGNTGVLIARGVTTLLWTHRHRGLGRCWHAVTGSTPDNHDNRFSLTLGFASDAELRVEAEAAEFYVGDIQDLDAKQPNIVEDDDEAVRAGMPSWGADFVPIAATFLDLPGDLPLFRPSEGRW